MSSELIDQHTLSLNDSALSILVNHPIAQAHSLTGRECRELLKAVGVCSEISVITPRSNALPDLLDALEIHLVDYPTPENIHMQRKYLSDIRQHHLKPVSGEVVAYVRDLDGTGSLHICAKGDKGARGVAYVD